MGVKTRREQVALCLLDQKIEVEGGELVRNHGNT
jgi:hypothetical protein